MTTSLSWIKALRSLDRDLLELANLTNQFHLFRKLGSFLILALLQALLKVTVYLISDRLVILLLQNNLLSSSLLVRMHL